MLGRGKPTHTSRFAIAALTARRSSWTSLICSAGIVVLPILATLASAQPSAAAGSKQVVYQTRDGHIHELSMTIDGTWQHADLTQLTGAPPTGTRFWGEDDTSPVGYAWNAGASKQVVYWGEDVHIHELYMRRGGSWQHADLTRITGAPIPVNERGNPQPRGPLSAYAWETGKSKQVVYLTWDGHIHELYVQLDGNWHHADLTRIAGAPTAEAGFTPCSFVSGYAWETGKSAQVAYITSNGDIHELYLQLGGNWRHADLTAVSGGWPIDPDRIKNFECRFKGYAWEAGGSKQVAYQLVEDRHSNFDLIGEMYVRLGNRWFFANTSLNTNEEQCTLSSAYAWEAGESKQVVCKDIRDAHILELYTVGGAWQSADLTELTGAPTPITSQVLGYSWEAGKSKQVVYTTRDGNIHELSIGLGGTWQHADLTELTGAPRPAEGSLLSAYGWND
jgi:hypothetical protein